MIVALAALSGSGFGAPSDWFGSWVLDRARSHLVGPVIRIGRTPQGYSFDFGAARFTIGDDGRDYPTVPTRSTSLKALGGRRWLRVHKINGKAIDRSRIEVTPNQRLMHIVSLAPGTARRQRSTETFDRVGAGQGLAGTWRSRTAGADVPVRFAIAAAPAGGWRLNYPDQRQFYLIVLGGAPAPLQGAQAVPGVAMKLWATSSRTFRWTESIGTKPYRQGFDRLLRNGRTIEETSWPSQDPSKRQVAVYERQ